MRKKWKLTENNLLKFSNDGLNAKQVSRLIGCSETTLREFRRLMEIDFDQNNMSADNKADLIYLRGKGYSIYDIAKILSVAESTVAYRLRAKSKSFSWGIQLPTNSLSREMREVMRGAWS